MEWWRNIILASTAVLLAALPSSTTYKLNSYGFGSGGTANSTSTNYGLNGSTGELSSSGSSTNYTAGSAENYLKQANVPILALSNTGLLYNKLRVTVDRQNNPSDATFAIAISKDNFATTKYVKSDMTVGNSLTTADYRTYASWGGSGGAVIRGLQPSTVYTVKGKAYRGKYTETGYGPTVSASTVGSALTFDIDVSATDISTSPPYVVNFGNLPVSTVTDSPVKIWVSFDTNADDGGSVYISGSNSGLKSASANYNIGSVTGDLAALTEGFGVQGSSATQSSGGPLTLTSPFDGTGANVGVEDANIREVFGAATPIIAGRGSLVLKAKTKPLTPSSIDYTETLTMVASGNF